MKKRSLFAAVAMLIVSAIVLTSATYAWFATGGNSEIKTIKGTVAAAASGIKLRTNVTGSSWENSLDYKTLAAVTTNHFATTWTNDGTAAGNLVNPDETGATAVEGTVYEPVSADPNLASNGTITFQAYQLANSGAYSAIASTASVTDFYDVYTFYVGTLSEDDEATTGDTDVDMKITLAGSAAPAARIAVFSSADSGAHWALEGVFSNAAETGWKPLIAALDLTNCYYNDDGDFIVDSGDDTDDTALASKISANAVTTVAAGSSNTTYQITLQDCHKIDGYTAEGSSTTLPNKLVKVYVWLEGNDTDCKPTQRGIPGGDIQASFDFKPGAVRTITP